ncbi:hypothetical protein [Candidatus Harpocratesius sp.]
MAKNEKESESENQQSMEEQPNISEKIEVFEKKAYLERALFGYAKKFLSQGYKRLTERQYIFFFYWTVGIMVSSIIISILYAMNYITAIEIVKTIIFLCLITAAALIIGGLVGGLSHNRQFLNIFTITLMALALIMTCFFAGLFPSIWVPNYNSIFLQWLKIFYFLIYVIISSISMFSIIWNFQTSFAYRFISLGKSPNRLLFQGIIRLGTIIAIPMYLYIFIQNSLDAQILAVMGIFITGILIVRFYHLPKFYKKDSFQEQTEKIAIMNYNQILGFYNLYLIYRLSQSFDTGGNITNLTVDLILLALNSFFIMNTLSKKIDNIGDEEDVQKSFIFQRNTGFMRWLKRTISEKGLILGVLGLALGYQAVYMDSYLDSPIVIIQILSDPNRVTPLNVTYNRTFLGIALLWMLGTMIAFQTSSKFRNMVINRYSVRHVLKMFGDLFRVSDEGKVGAVLEAYESGIKKVEKKIANASKKVKGKWNRFFSFGSSSDEENQ